VGIPDIVVLEAFTPEGKASSIYVRRGAARTGKHPVDAMLDLAVADDLRTVFYAEPANVDRDAMREIVAYDWIVPGVSDGGAHTKFFTGGRYPTEFLSRIVREEQMCSLEHAHWRLSTLPAHCAGFRDRGTLVEGAPADVVVYDFENLAALPTEVAHDVGRMASHPARARIPLHPGDRRGHARGRPETGVRRTTLRHGGVARALETEPRSNTASPSGSVTATAADRATHRLARHATEVALSAPPYGSVAVRPRATSPRPARRPGGRDRRGLQRRRRRPGSPAATQVHQRALHGVAAVDHGALWLEKSSGARAPSVRGVQVTYPALDAACPAARYVSRGSVAFPSATAPASPPMKRFSR
jgi:hypothetical protein